MKTFTFKYSKNNKFVYDSDFNYIKECLLCEMNTQKGEVPYKPDYGTKIPTYKYRLVNYSLYLDVYREIVEVVSGYPELELRDYQYDIKDRTISYSLVLGYNGRVSSVDLEYSSGRVV